MLRDVQKAGLSATIGTVLVFLIGIGIFAGIYYGIPAVFHWVVLLFTLIPLYIFRYFGWVCVIIAVCSSFYMIWVMWFESELRRYSLKIDD